MTVPGQSRRSYGSSSRGSEIRMISIGVEVLVENKFKRREKEEGKSCSTHFQKSRNFIIKLIFRLRRKYLVVVLLE